MTVRRYLPLATGLAVAAVAAANLLDLLWPGVAEHLRILALLVPRHAVPWAHALAAPVAVLMLLLGWALTQRRRAALAIAVAMLGVMAVTMAGERRPVDAVACAVLAVSLYLARGAWPVMPPAGAARRSLVRVPVATAGALLVGLLAVLVAHGDAVPQLGGADVLREAVALLAWHAGPVDFPAAFHWLPEALALVGIAALVLVLAPLLARPPLRAMPQSVDARQQVDALACRPDSGSLSQFVLRADHQWLFAPGGDAALAYRVEAGVLLVAGDPVGDPGAFPALVSTAAGLAERHGLLLGVMAGADHLRPLWRGVGLRAAYLGDEAVVSTGTFTTHGRAMRKVRQSVTRAGRQGYTARLVRLRDLAPAERHALERFRAECRGGTPERGFSMAGDRIADPGSQPSWVAIATGPHGATAAVIHFVPGHGGSTQSLSMMLRGAGTPNGLMEFLVVRAIQGFGAMGVTDVSLNFVTGGRYLRQCRTPVERLHARAWRFADRFFQVKRLERFTEKFQPRWEPRHVMHPGFAVGYLRVGMAATWAEGQVPRPRQWLSRPAPGRQAGCVDAPRSTWPAGDA